MVGKSLSHYKIVSELGRGGMGIVYKAEDTKLGRTVAIKVLPSATLASKEDRARFYREAKAAAALNHPNIASIYEIDEAAPSGAPHDAQPSPFIAMEYIEGTTLDQRIKEGPLKMKEAIRLASQIASGLEAAHEKDIVHRDIKASNIMLTTKGEVKILDFGLAQTAQSTKLTRMGSTLGTVANMSPEQARGEEVDRRSDLWSLGTVLYEMVSGSLPFGGDYEQAIIYSILNEDPEPLSALRTGVPFAVEGIAEKCLRKDPAHRYQTAADIIADLESIRSGSGTRTRTVVQETTALPVTANEQSTLRNARLHVTWLVALVVVSVSAIYLAGAMQSEPDLPLAFFEISESAGGYPFGVNRSAISPDGQRIVLEKDGQIWIRELSQSAERVLQGADGGTSPFWSPDSRNLAFFRDGSLWKADLARGSASVITTFGGGTPWSGTWTAEGEIYFLTVKGPLKTTLYKTLERGGQAEEVILPDSMSFKGALFNPLTLSEGDGMFVYWNQSLNDDRGASGAYRIAGNQASQITSPEFLAHIVYDPAGYLLYDDFGETGLWALPYLPGKEPITESPILLIRDAFAATVANNGSLVYELHEEALRQFGWVDMQGKNLGLIGGARMSARDASFSPDGSTYIFVGAQNASELASATNLSNQLFIHHVDSETEQPIGELNGMVQSPAFSSDGQRIAFSYNWDIWLTDVSGSRLDILERSDGSLGSPSWTPDGKVLYADYSEGGGDIWIRDPHPDSTARLIIATPALEFAPTVSPEGKYLAYIYSANIYISSANLGDLSVFIRPYGDANEPARRIGPGAAVRWSRDGRELFIMTADSMYRWNVPVDLSGSLTPPVALFGLEGLELQVEAGFDIAPEGDRFLMTFQTGESTVKTMLVQNWKRLLDE